MSSFRAGQRVRCLNADRTNGRLTAGREYVVLDVEEHGNHGWVQVTDDDRTYAATRFEAVVVGQLDAGAGRSS